MEQLLDEIIRFLIAVGPLVVFIVTAVETAFFIGLLVPAEATVLVAAFLASERVFALDDVLLATLAGAFVGDQIGYALGRFGGTRMAARGGRLGRLWQRNEARALAMFRQRTIVAVSLARFVSFVRTLMPWFAGMTRMHWARFVVYDALGVAGWGIASVAAGYIAGESWTVLAGWLGTASAIIVVALGLVAGVLMWRRRRQQTDRAVVAGPESPAAEPASLAGPADPPVADAPGGP